MRILSFIEDLEVIHPPAVRRAGPERERWRASKPITPITHHSLAQTRLPDGGQA